MKIETIEDKETFLESLKEKLSLSEEAKFWQIESLQAADVILDTLLALYRQRLLFSPEGRPVDSIDLDTFLVWFDLVSLKNLAFTLDLSNQTQRLQNTRYEHDRCASYLAIDISSLAKHLQNFSIDFNDPLADFPSRFYVKHKEYAEIIRRMMR